MNQNQEIPKQVFDKISELKKGLQNFDKLRDRLNDLHKETSPFQKLMRKCNNLGESVRQLKEFINKINKLGERFHRTVIHHFVIVKKEKSIPATDEVLKILKQI